MTSATLALLGLAIVAIAGVVWARRMRTLRLSRDKRGFLAAMAVGALLGVAAWVAGPGLLSGLVGAVAFLVGGGFLALQLLSRQDPGQPAVAVGGPILDFRATDADGHAFRLASLRGRPFLLKFFRGHW